MTRQRSVGFLIIAAFALTMTACNNASSATPAGGGFVDLYRGRWRRGADIDGRRRHARHDPRGRRRFHALSAPDRYGHHEHVHGRLRRDVATRDDGRRTHRVRQRRRTVATRISPRDDGTTQATYCGHPLYRYSGDSAAGDTNGEAVGGVWYATAADGTAAMDSGGGHGSGY